MAEKFAALSWPKILFISLLLAGVFYYLKSDDLAAVEKQKLAADTELQSARNLLKDTKKAIDNLTQFEEQTRAFDNELKQLIAYLPTENNSTEIISILTQESQKAGISITKLEPLGSAFTPPRKTPGPNPAPAPSDGVPDDFFSIAKVEVSMQGSFSQIMIFLSNLTHVKRVYMFPEFEMSVDSDPAKINFKGTLSAFSYANKSADATGDSNAKTN